MIEIQKFNPSHYDVVIKLYKELWETIETDTEYTRKYLERYEKSNGYGAFVAIDKNIIGFVSYKILDAIWLQGKYIYISELIIRREYRKKGIGKLLLDKIHQIGKENECKRIELDTSNSRHDAQLFYEKYGFENRARVYTLNIK